MFTSAAKVLAGTPLPVVVAAAAYQLPEGLMEGAPGWALAAAVLVYVTLYSLNQFGLLKAKNGADRRKAAFQEDDREKLDTLYNLLAYRSSDDGIERFLKFLQEQREVNAVLVEQQKETNRLLAEFLTNIDD